MDAVERAVRAALDKGNALDRGFRLKIYASAQAALERTLAARAADAAGVDARRRHLATVIATIEREFLPAMPADPLLDAPAVAAPHAAAAHEAAHQAAHAAAQATAHELAPPVEAVAPARRSDPPSGWAPPAHEPAPSAPPVASPVAGGPVPHVASAGPAAPSAPVPAADRPIRLGRARPAPAGGGRRLPWVRWGFNAAFLVAVGLGGWWLYAEAMRQYELATSDAPGRPQLTEPGNAAPGAADTALVGIFAPQDAPLLTVPPGAEARLGNHDGMEALSIRSGAPGTALSIKVGEGVLQTFAGRRVLFTIKARSENGAVVDTAVGCSFAGLASCERKRFRIAPEVAEYMFAVTLAAGDPQGDGVIEIEPDLSGGGAPVQIFSIKVGAVEAD